MMNNTIYKCTTITHWLFCVCVCVVAEFRVSVACFAFVTARFCVLCAHLAGGRRAVDTMLPTIPKRGTAFEIARANNREMPLVGRAIGVARHCLRAAVSTSCQRASVPLALSVCACRCEHLRCSIWTERGVHGASKIHVAISLELWRRACAEHLLLHFNRSPNNRFRFDSRSERVKQK